jgi:protein-tyrosine phosphatase
MWFFSKKKLQKAKKISYDIASYMEVDIHSHLLPGIDDGAQDITHSLKLLSGLKEKGIRRVVTSPHVMADIHKNTPQTIHTAYQTLLPHLAPSGINIPFSYGAEYMLDEQFLDKLNNQEILPLFDNYILVETPFLFKPLNIEEDLFQIQAAGFIPILAHPERYVYMFGEQELYFKMKSLGCLLQMNILSATGYYGKMEKDAAKFLLKNNLYTYFGTDMHHDRHLHNFLNFQVDEEVARLLDQNFDFIKNRTL